MKHYSDRWIEEWCLKNGWSDLYIEENQYWAFRPGAVMPEPIPNDILRSLKRQKGLSPSEKWWSTIAIATTIISLIVTIYFFCPIFLVLAFGIDSFAVANLELSEI